MLYPSITIKDLIPIFVQLVFPQLHHNLDFQTGALVAVVQQHLFAGLVNFSVAHIFGCFAEAGRSTATT